MNSTRAAARSRWWRSTALVIALGPVTACGQGASERSLEAADPASGASESPPASSGLPVQEPSGEIDETLAANGEALFNRRGCVACHKLGAGRLVGPDLAGITERRSFEWTYRMITAPDSMLKTDSVAKSLFVEYLTPMPNQGVRPDEALQLYEYLRAYDAGVSGSSTAGSSSSGTR